MIVGYVHLTKSGLSLASRRAAADSTSPRGPAEVLLAPELYIEGKSRQPWPSSDAPCWSARSGKMTYLTSEQTCLLAAGLVRSPHTAAVVPLGAVGAGDRALSTSLINSFLRKDGPRTTSFDKLLDRSHARKSFKPNSTAGRATRISVLVLLVLAVTAAIGFWTAGGRTNHGATDPARQSTQSAGVQNLAGEADPGVWSDSDDLDEDSREDQQVPKALEFALAVAHIIGPGVTVGSLSYTTTDFGLEISGRDVFGPFAGIQALPATDRLTLDVIPTADERQAAIIGGVWAHSSAEPVINPEVAPGLPMIALPPGQWVASARERGLEVERVSVRDKSGHVDLALSGPSVAVMQWLGELEANAGALSTDQTGGSAISRLQISTAPVGLRLEASLTGRGVNPPGQTSDTAETRAAEDRKYEELAAIFEKPGGPLQLTPVIAAGTPDPPLRTTLRQTDPGVRLLGSVVSAGVEKFVLWFDRPGMVRTVATGDKAFGWELYESTENQLRLRNGGQFHELPR